MTFRTQEVISLMRTRPELTQRIVAAGRFSANRVTVTVPDDFDLAAVELEKVEPHPAQGAPAPPSMAALTAGIGVKMEEPTLGQLAENFATATAKWAAAGCPVVTATQYEARSATCAGCEFWDGKARFGLGKCKVPGCGCTKFKRWLATEKCPKDKWPKD